MNNSVEYRGILLMRGSLAYELWHDPKDAGHKKLDKHLKELDQKDKELKERYKEN